MNTRLRLLLFVVASSIATVSVVDVQASRGYSTEWQFFSNDSPYVIVGEGYTECNWSFTMWWGQQTNNYSGFDTVCGGGSGSGTACPGGCPSGWICVVNQGCQIPQCYPNCYPWW